MERIYSLKVSQFALCQFRLTGTGEVAEGRANVTVTELWSEVVPWSIARARIEMVISPRERQRSIVDGVLPFLG